MSHEPARQSSLPFVHSIASIEPRLDKFLSRLMLRSTGKLDGSDLEDDFERLDVLDGVHKPRRKH